MRQVGSATSEGDGILNADVARQQFAIDGTGVRVGVLSDGLKGVFASGCTTCGGVANGPLASGDLPNATGTRSGAVLTTSSGGITGQSFQANHDLEGLPSGACGFAGAGAEGTALLEIVHDVAPGAQLAFANADTDLTFNQAVNFLAANNDVVVDDLGFFGFAYDGTSLVSTNTASALNNGANRIRTYVTSVGNAANGHYLGSYVNSGVDGLSISGVVNSGHLHLFQGSDETTDVLGLGSQPHDAIVLPTNGEVVIFLTWDDPAGRSANNYDLYLVQQSTGRVVARSIDTQAGAQDPREVIDFTNRGGSDTFFIVVQNVRDAAAPRQLSLFLFEPECAVDGPRLLATGRHERHNYNTMTRSVSAQSDAGGSPVSVISVGAICSASAAAAGVFAGSSAPSESCNDRSHLTAEFFSSRGPTLDNRMKPDIAAIDGVTVTGAGSFENPFFGTSAAAPHVAGEAALLLQAAPCLLSGSTAAIDAAAARTRLRNLILSRAMLIGDAPDNTFGAGLANAFASLTATLPVLTGPSSIVVSGNAPAGADLTPALLGFSDPNSCPVTRLNWTGGCGSGPGSAISCPFGTSSIGVSASNNGLAFSDAAPIEITVTNFALAAAPASATVTAGQSATYHLTLAAQGGAFANPVSLSCRNLPVGAACSFGPAPVTPGAGAADSTLTITTAPRPRASQARVGPIDSAARISQSISTSALSIALLATLALAARRRPRRMLSRMLAALVVVYSCGGSNNGATVTPTPTPTATPSPGPAATLSPASLAFGNQDVQSSSGPQVVTITNTGSATLALNGIAITGDFSETTTCGASLAAGASCAMSVTFTPTMTGARTGTVTITDNSATSPHVVALSGTGIVPAGGTPAGTYQVAVVGASGALVQTQTVTLVVQ